MKKISVFIVLVMVFALFASVCVNAADSVPVLVYEPSTKTYTPGDTVEMKTVAKGNNLKFSWLVVVSTDTQDYTFDFSKQAGVMNFEALDPTGKMKAKMSVSGASDGKTTATLTFENIAMFDYGIFVTCTVANSVGYKDTDKAALYPSYSAPPIPEIEIISELDVRIGKLIKLACNVYPPNGVEYDNIEYVWYTTPDGDKSNGEKIDDEDYSVLVVDTGAGGIYFYYCSIYIQKGVSSYYYESPVTMIRVHEPVMDVTYTPESCELGAGDTAVIKANVKFENNDEKGTLSYQWMTGNNNIPGTYTAIKGATSDKLTVKGDNSEGTKYYCCVVTNEIDGYVFSNDSSDIPIIAVKSTGEHTPEIFMSPKDAYATEGDEVTFAVDASYAATYEWFMVKPGGAAPVKLKDGLYGVTSGAETSILKVKASADNNGAFFYCDVYGLNGKYVTTDKAALTVHLIPPDQPVINKHPRSMTANAGTSISLAVDASSPDGGELRYQWYVNDKADYKGMTALEGATGGSVSVNVTDDPQYFCVAVWNMKNGYENGPVYSDFAKVESFESLTEETATGTAEITGESGENPGIVTGGPGVPVTDEFGSVVTGETVVTDEFGSVIVSYDGLTSVIPVGSGNGTNGTIIVLLIIIICMLVLAIAGAVVFIVLKLNKKQ